MVVSSEREVIWAKAVIFDYNGTLLDDVGPSYSSVVGIFKHYGLKAPSLDQYRSEVSSDFMPFYHGHGIPSSATAEDLNVIRRDYFLRNWHETQLRSDAKSVIDELTSKGMPLGIVSSEVDNLIKRRLKEDGLIYRFHSIKADVRDKEEALLEAAHEMSVHPMDTIYVDDTVDGNRAAVDVGMHAVGFGQGFHSVDRIREVTSLIIFELSELLSIVRTIR
jgi:phosphoglycolate phosphatase